MDSKFQVSAHPLTDDPLWNVDDVDLAVCDAGESFVRAFIEQHRHDDYTLSVFDSLTNQAVEIICDVDNIPRIVSYLYHLEHATPLRFISLNSLTKSYVVGMSLTRGKIEVGAVYQDVNGRLKKLSA